MPVQVVTSGPFRFCSKGHLDAARLKLLETATDFNTGLTGASINGQSFQFTAPDQQTYTREEYADHLAAAYNQLGIFDYGTPTGNRASIRFG